MNIFNVQWMSRWMSLVRFWRCLASTQLIKIPAGKKIKVLSIFTSHSAGTVLRTQENKLIDAGQLYYSPIKEWKWKTIIYN